MEGGEADHRLELTDRRRLNGHPAVSWRETALGGLIE